ncbi:enoyl-CoA hydratase [Rugosimonospora africana]|uniref:Enoyl-CoA hydratase n=1 Tax=Rugosimonospora africana TaxID=556532 RepID=A0A8J3QYK8_9ACTN|nr:enoyl-CoA hydratase [Rugosimonospora africana]GIH19263.1 enoyl-CoA hydratase [Rugosimonospora africana]
MSAGGAVRGDGEGRVELRVDGDFAQLTLANPDRLNALTFTMYDQLTEACDRLRSSAVRVVSIRGAGGKAFAAGTDIAGFAGFDADDGVAYEHRTAAVLDALAGLPMPVIAAVEGPAVGAGLALTLACDLVLATPDAVFGAPVARTLGNCLSPGIIGRLYATVGRARARQLLMTATTLDAQGARDCGLVTEVVARDRLDGHLADTRRRLAALAPLTLRAFKEVDRRLMRCFDQIDADDLYRMCYGSRDFSEGVAAFAEKRAPEWQGR